MNNFAQQQPWVTPIDLVNADDLFAKSPKVGDINLYPNSAPTTHGRNSPAFRGRGLTPLPGRGDPAPGIENGNVQVEASSSSYNAGGRSMSHVPPPPLPKQRAITGSTFVPSAFPGPSVPGVPHAGGKAAASASSQGTNPPSSAAASSGTSIVKNPFETYAAGGMAAVLGPVRRKSSKRIDCPLQGNVVAVTRTGPSSPSSPTFSDSISPMDTSVGVGARLAAPRIRVPSLLSVNELGQGADDGAAHGSSSPVLESVAHSLGMPPSKLPGVRFSKPDSPILSANLLHPQDTTQLLRRQEGDRGDDGTMHDDEILPFHDFKDKLFNEGNVPREYFEPLFADTILRHPSLEEVSTIMQKHYLYPRSAGGFLSFRDFELYLKTMFPKQHLRPGKMEKQINLFWQKKNLHDSAAVIKNVGEQILSHNEKKLNGVIVAEAEGRKAILGDAQAKHGVLLQSQAEATLHLENHATTQRHGIVNHINAQTQGLTTHINAQTQGLTNHMSTQSQGIKDHIQGHIDTQNVGMMTAITAQNQELYNHSRDLNTQQMDLVKEENLKQTEQIEGFTTAQTEQIQEFIKEQLRKQQEADKTRQEAADKRFLQEVTTTIETTGKKSVAAISTLQKSVDTMKNQSENYQKERLQFMKKTGPGAIGATPYGAGGTGVPRSSNNKPDALKGASTTRPVGPGLQPPPGRQMASLNPTAHQPLVAPQQQYIPDGFSSNTSSAFILTRPSLKQRIMQVRNPGHGSAEQQTVEYYGSLGEAGAGNAALQHGEGVPGHHRTFQGRS
ncbi:unnamed protein product [Amoebophrya sp. A120]|nr:unnamed protein product [Amoebophrya sp. A120]|eukprot:GSA120T00000534001.1